MSDRSVPQERGVEETGVMEGEREAVQFHSTVAADGLNAWRQGLNLLLNLEDLHAVVDKLSESLGT
jgi:hypothetical protein